MCLQCIICIMKPLEWIKESSFIDAKVVYYGFRLILIQAKLFFSGKIGI